MLVLVSFVRVQARGGVPLFNPNIPTRLARRVRLNVLVCVSVFVDKTKKIYCFSF